MRAVLPIRNSDMCGNLGCLKPALVFGNTWWISNQGDLQCFQPSKSVPAQCCPLFLHLHAGSGNSSSPKLTQPAPQKDRKKAVGRSGGKAQRSSQAARELYHQLKASTAQFLKICSSPYYLHQQTDPLVIPRPSPEQQVSK